MLIGKSDTQGLLSEVMQLKNPPSKQQSSADHGPGSHNHHNNPDPNYGIYLG